MFWKYTQILGGCFLRTKIRTLIKCKDCIVPFGERLNLSLIITLPYLFYKLFQFLFGVTTRSRLADKRVTMWNASKIINYYFYSLLTYYSIPSLNFVHKKSTFSSFAATLGFSCFRPKINFWKLHAIKKHWKKSGLQNLQISVLNFRFRIMS